MIEINITEFKGYDQEAFQDFLELQEGYELRVSVPKQTALYRNSHLEIATEYTHMLLLGQKLCALADDFLYELPRLDVRERFVFYVRRWQAEPLATLLALLVSFQAEENIEAYMDFDVEAAELLGRGSEEVEYACYDFYVLASNFLLIEDSENRS
jgi:hypothetical protein